MNNSTTPGQTPHLAIDRRVATITLRRSAVANRLELEDLQTLQAQVDEFQREVSEQDMKAAMPELMFEDPKVRS